MRLLPIYRHQFTSAPFTWDSIFFSYKKTTNCTNFSDLFGMTLYMFPTVSLSIIRSFPLYTQQWCMSYRSADSLRAGSGCNCKSILILLVSCQQNCMTYTIAVCTVENSWRWTEKLSKTCRVSFQNKSEKLVHIVLLLKKFITMHGHMNLKFHILFLSVHYDQKMNTLLYFNHWNCPLHLAIYAWTLFLILILCWPCISV